MKNLWTSTRVAVAALASWAALFPGVTQAQALRTVAAGPEDGTVQAVAVEDGRVRAYLGAAEEGAPRAAAESADGALFPANQRWVSSQDGSQVGRVTYRGSEEGGLTSVFERRGEAETWRAELPGPARFLISDDGSLVVGVLQDLHAARALVVFYGPGGQELGRLEQPVVRQVAVSDNGDRVAINTGGEGVLVADERGRIVHRLPAASDIRLSGDGATLALLGGASVDAYRGGERVASLATEGPARDAALDRAGERLAVAERGRLRVHDVATGRTLFARPAGRKLEFRSVALTDDGRVAAGLLRVDAKRRHDRDGRATGEVLLLSPEGALLGSETFTPAAWNRATPDVRFLRGLGDPVVITRNAVYTFELAPAAN